MGILRSRSSTTLPGVVGPARLQRGWARRGRRAQQGDVVVLDRLDLDRASAQALVDAGVAAVVDTGPFLSGRYPSLGPEVLAEAGVVLVDQTGPDTWTSLREGMRLRLHDGALHLGDEPIAQGRELDLVTVRAEMTEARQQMRTQLESFTHNSAELLRREEALLLHGQGLPELRIQVRGRPVVVVADGSDTGPELAAIDRYVDEQAPVVIAVDGAAVEADTRGVNPDVVVLSGGADVETGVPPELLNRAGEVVVCVDRGVSRSAADELERLGVRPRTVETQATPEDVALLLADDHDADLIVGVGMHATLDDFLDRRRAGLASTFLTRLRVGDRLVDAATVPSLYAGRVRPVHLLLVLLAALVALSAAVGITPAGQEWTDAVADLIDNGYDSVRGLL